MKKIYFFAIMMAFAGILSAQSFTITPSPTVTETMDVRNSLDVYIHFTNNTQASQALKWKGEVTSLTQGWVVTICDNGSCFSVPHTNTETMIAVSAGDSSFLKGTFTPDNIPGSATISFLVWDAGDSVNTATEVTMIVNAGTTSVSSTLLKDKYTVSPTPATDVLHLRAKNGALDKGEVQLYNLKGQVVLRKNINAVQSADFNVNDLAPGIYMLRYATKAGTMTQKVVIAH